MEIKSIKSLAEKEKTTIEKLKEIEVVDLK